MAPRRADRFPHVTIKIERYEGMLMHSALDPKRRIPQPGHWRVRVNRVAPAATSSGWETHEMHSFRVSHADLPSDSSVSEVLYALADAVRESELGAT